MARVVLDIPAAQQIVDGVLLPRPVAGHPALELCNTKAGWGEPTPRDYLVSYRHLLALTRSLGLVSSTGSRRLARVAVEDPAAAHRQLTRSRQLRDDLYAVLVHADRSALPRLNAVLARSAASRRIEAATGRRIRWGFADDGLSHPVTALAWQAHQLLADDLAAQVRACPGEGCGWLFIDGRGQRRWCVMSLCGNRAKVRRHAQRARRR
jgi:predicted RNA-binding Zn ribbon-like protein